MNRSLLKRVYAHFDAQGVYVYQAFTPSIVHAAVAKGTFGAGFGMDRMTWIKPSFGWMLQRCGYASKHNQEAVARIHLSHDGWLALLGEAVLSTFGESGYDAEGAWKDALARSEVRVQWDPDRDLTGRVLEHRAIQVGLRGLCVRRYVNEWVLGVEDVTALTCAIGQAVQNRTPLPAVPNEREYPLPPATFARLNCTAD